MRSPLFSTKVFKDYSLIGCLRSHGPISQQLYNFNNTVLFSTCILFYLYSLSISYRSPHTQDLILYCGMLEIDYVYNVYKDQ